MKHKWFLPYLSSGSELVEDMVVSLLRGLGRDPGLFQKVILDDAAFDLELGVEAHLHEPSKPGRIVVSDRFGIAWNKRKEKEDILNEITTTSLHAYHVEIGAALLTSVPLAVCYIFTFPSTYVLMMYVYVYIYIECVQGQTIYTYCMH